MLLPPTTGSEALDRRARIPRSVPAARTRAERFDDHVLAAVEELEERWSTQLERVEFAVEEVPPADVAGADAGIATVLTDAEPVPLSRLTPATGSGRSGSPPRIVVYRRPIEARSGDPADRADLVLDVLVHEVARLLGLSPEEVDPEGHGHDWDDDD